MKNGVRTFICGNCGRTVTKSCPKTAKFCSTACFHSSGRKGRKKTGIEKECVSCGKQFYVPRSRGGRAIACSKKCSEDYQKRTKIKLQCSTCGTSFIRSPSFSGQKYCSIKCRNESQEFILHTLRMGSDQNKRKDANALEMCGHFILDEIGVRYEKQYTIGGRFTVDVFIRDTNSVIQFDGDYWHGNKSKYPNPDNRQKKRMALDISQDAYMNKIGIRVLRIWEHEFLYPYAVHQKIISFLFEPEPVRLPEQKELL